MNNEDYYLNIQRNGGQVNYPLGQQDSQRVNADERIYGGPILPTPILPAPRPDALYSQPASFNSWRVATVIIPMLIIVAASIALAYYTGYWLLVIVLPPLVFAAALTRSLRPQPAPSAPGYLTARLVAALISFAILAALLIFLLCQLNSVL